MRNQKSVQLNLLMSLFVSRSESKRSLAVSAFEEMSCCTVYGMEQVAASESAERSETMSKRGIVTRSYTQGRLSEGKRKGRGRLKSGFTMGWCRLLSAG
jgi:hypothetical protein